MRVHLRPCAHCARHIRITEARCVFCGAPVDAARRSAPPLGDAASRLRRAATVAAIGTAAGAGVGLEACGSDQAPPVTTFADAYGAVPFVEAPDAAADGEAGLGTPDAAADAPPVIMADAAYGTTELVETREAATDGSSDSASGEDGGQGDP